LKGPANRSANRSHRIKAPTSMFRVYGAFVKFAEVTNAIRRPIAIHFA
jgi:hypothetical protein